MSKHHHIAGRPRDYISRRRFYRARHRGQYQPNEHWHHTRCYPCEFRVKLTVQLGPPPDPIVTVPVLFPPVPSGMPPFVFDPPWDAL